MDTMGAARRRRNRLVAAGTIGVMTMLAVTGLFYGSSRAEEDEKNSVALSAGAGAPRASGNAEITLRQGVVAGEVDVTGLPPQPFASGRFYGVWFVRADGSKAFLGALIRRESIIFSTGGNGHMDFAANQFTTGPAAGFPITFGSAGTNVIVVLIENSINGLTPSPVGPVPGTGVAVIGTF